MKLTPKQKAFCDYYIQTGNATESARRAGYSEKTADVIGRENLGKPLIKNYIDERMKKIEDSRIADAAEVMRYLSSVMRNEITEDTVVVEGIGDGCSEARIVKKEISAKDRTKAAELLAKRYGILTEKQEINANVGVQIVDDI